MALAARSFVLVVATTGACLGGCTASSPSAAPTAPTEATPPSSPQPGPEAEPRAKAETETTPAPPIEGYAELAEVLKPFLYSWYSAPTRIGIARLGAVRFHPEGPDLGLATRDALPQFRRLPVLEDSERPRVVADEDGVRLLLYVDRADARPVVVSRAPVRPKPSVQFRDPPKRGHAVLQPGAWVEVVTRQQNAVEVKHHDQRLTTGWIDPDALGTSYTIPAPDEDEDQSKSGDPIALVTKRSTAILTRPGGKRLKAVPNDEVVVALTSRPRDGYRLVEYEPGCHRDVSYVGFVATRDLFSPNYGRGFGCGTSSPRYQRLWGSAQNEPRHSIEAGRFLLDPERPTVVIGCVTQATELAYLGEGHYAVATMWGPIPVRLAPEDFEGECGTQR